MKKITPFLLVAAGLVAGFLLRPLLFTNSTSTAECCKTTDTCQLAAPQNFTSTQSTNGLQLSWDTVTGAKYYQVNVVDITAETPVPALVRTTTETSILVTDGSLNPSHNYRSSVAAVCTNCTTSLSTASSDACSIVIEDILMMEGSCLTAGCNCTSTTPADGLTATSFNVVSTRQLHKVTFACSPGGKISWFIIQTHTDASGKLVVNVPDYSDMNDGRNEDCANCTSYDAPVKTGCGQMTNTDPAFTMNIAKTATGGTISFTGLTGCTMTAVKCNGCN